ncbi:MAG TPA: hydroxymethylbilane synthase [Actinomycetota bacterium]|nr:hydroxymethylbilane synthase [Actinomycetota bacterium]
MTGIVIATRGSALALRQTEIIADLLRSAYPEIDIEISTVTTRGDADDRSFAEIGVTSLFAAAVEERLIDGRADIAVHSAKDVTTVLAPGCTIVCIPSRAEPHDVVIGGTGDTGEQRLGSLSDGATVGTSSMRRRAQIAAERPDLNLVEFRGNLDTRMRRVASGEVDAAVVAAAGLARLGAADPAAGALDPEWWIPAPGQGALLVEARSDRADLHDLFEGLGNPASTAEVAAERAFAATLEGGCSVPLGCLARSTGASLIVTGYLGAPDGTFALRDRISGHISEAASLGRELAEAILGSGGDEILADVRAAATVPPAEP